MKGTLLGKAPTTAQVICLTVIVIVLIGSVTLLVYSGRDSRAVVDLVQILMTGASAVGAAGTLLYAGAAAKQADTVDRKISNGHLTEKVREGVIEAATQLAEEDVRSAH
jgi:hypothetical protein